MYPKGNLFIEASHGKLEAILKEPKGDAKGVALVCHPHPLGGGTMHNKVVFRAAAGLVDAGLITLRFNFRGVGNSTGAHDEGEGEKQDVLDALDYLSENYPGSADHACRIFVRLTSRNGSGDERRPRNSFNQPRNAGGQIRFFIFKKFAEIDSFCSRRQRRIWLG